MGPTKHIMGITQAKLSSSVYSEYDENTTPLKCHIQKRLLSVDPRSPTDNIVRTPIVVDKTPDDKFDPRSPTSGILRTPLPLILGESSEDVSESSALENDDKEMAGFSTGTDTALQNLGYTVDEVEMETPPSSRECKVLHKIDNSSPVFHDGFTQVQVKSQPKQLFSSKHHTHINKVSAPRSPLATVIVDINSPRNILQRKHKKHLTNQISGTGNQQSYYLDKENVMH